MAQIDRDDLLSSEHAPKEFCGPTKRGVNSERKGNVDQYLVSLSSLRTHARMMVVVVRGRVEARWRAVLASLRIGTMDKSRSSFGIISIVAYPSYTLFFTNAIELQHWSLQTTTAVTLGMQVRSWMLK